MRILRRNRYDSGIDDDIAESSSCSNHWHEAINRWSSDAHSILSQETYRMETLTEELASSSTSTADDEVTKRDIQETWKNKIRDIMVCTVDLIACLSDDVLEDTLSSEENSSLEDIPEEKHNPLKHVLKRRRRSSTELKRMLKILANSSTACEDLALLEKLKKNPRFNTLKDSHYQETSSFKDPEKVGPSDDNCEIGWCSSASSDTGEDVEDIFLDYVQLLEDESKSRDVNNIFWDISMEHDTRKMEDELSNLAVSDQSDVANGQCEATGRKAAFPIRGRSKMYWNIFKAWRHNFVHEKKRDKICKPPARTASVTKNRIFGANNATWYHYPSRYPKTPSESYTEDYFKEFKHFFDIDAEVRRPVRRKTVENDLPVSKKPRFEAGYPQNETYGIDERFVLYPGTKSFETQEDLYHASHLEFCRLRRFVQIQRAERRCAQDSVDSVDFFDDWKHNLTIRQTFDSSPLRELCHKVLSRSVLMEKLDIVQVFGIKESYERTHAEFCRLRSTVRNRRLQNRINVELTTHENWFLEWHWRMDVANDDCDKVSKNLAKKEAKRKNSMFPIKVVIPFNPPPAHMELSKHSLNSFKFTKFHHQRMMKCFAKQPCPRGRV